MLGVDDLELSRERSLVERMQFGDEEAFEELYHRHYQRLYRYCLYRLGEAHEAQDITQEAFTRAWVHAPRLAADVKFYPWLRTVAGNLCTDVGRRRARVQPASEIDPGATDGGQERIVDDVDLTLLEQAMSRLPERHRRVLELREAGGLSYQQLAYQTGTSVGTVESLLWRARQGLKRQFGVVSGESVLTGLPIIGWLLRRAHAAHARVSAHLAEWHPENLSALGGAIGGLAVGSVVAVAVIITGVGHQGSQVPPAAIATTVPVSSATVAADLNRTVAQPASQQSPAISTAESVQHTVSATGTTAPRRSPDYPQFVNPINTNPAAAQEEAKQDPVRVSIAQTTVGVDPQTVDGYVTSLLPPLPLKLP